MHPGRGRKRRDGRSNESGYAYLMALFLMLAVIIASQVAMQNLVTEGRRQREEQTIWCGNQWARAVRLYFHKTGHYPQSIDDLEMGVPDVHFLRQSAYKDPMEAEEGTWRFIYVNASGQIIGSVRYATLQQMALIDLTGATISALPGGFPGIPVSSIASSNTDANSASTASGANSSGANNATPGGSQTGVTSSQTSPGSTSNTPSSSTATSQSSTSDQSGFMSSSQSGTSAPGQIPNPLLALQPTGPVDSPVIGAFLTGVGIPTKVDRNSVRIYHGAKKYKDWEFIWNPLEDQAQALQQGLNPQGVQGPQIGQPIGAGGIGGGSLGNPGFGGAVVPPSSNPPPTPSPAPQ
jgi:hypothetical protein